MPYAALLIWVLAAIFVFCGLNAKLVLGVDAPGFYLAAVVAAGIGVWLFANAGKR